MKYYRHLFISQCFFSSQHFFSSQELFFSSQEHFFSSQLHLFSSQVHIKVHCNTILYSTWFCFVGTLLKFAMESMYGQSSAATSISTACTSRYDCSGRVSIFPCRPNREYSQCWYATAPSVFGLTKYSIKYFGYTLKILMNYAKTKILMASGLFKQTSWVDALWVRLNPLS